MITFIRKRSRTLDVQFVIGLIAINFSLLLVLTPFNHFIEMMQSLSLQILLGMLFFTLILAFRKRWLSVGLGCVALMLLGGHLNQNVNFIADNPSATKSDLRFAHFNVLKYNDKYNEMINLALESGADFISFNEVTASWSEQLSSGLNEKYPFQHVVPQEGSFGISIYSKHPLTETLVHWQDNNIPYLSGSILFNTEQIFYIAAHTIPPTNAASFQKRNAQIQEIENLLKIKKRPKLLLGDLNAVGWSSSLRKLKENTALCDSRKSIAGTYPSWSKFFRIPIDHIYHSDDLYCNSFKTIESKGSDHLGIIATFSLVKSIALAKN